MEAAQIEVSPADPAATAQALRGADLRPPLACDSAEQIAAGGECFQLTTPGAASAFVVRRKGPTLWIDGAGVIHGNGQLHIGLDLAKEIARELGCSEVAFETGRRGLVRAAAVHGFEVAGFIMKAKIK